MCLPRELTPASNLSFLPPSPSPFLPQVVIFVQSKRSCAALADRLRQLRHLEASEFHGGLTPEGKYPLSLPPPFPRFLLSPLVFLVDFRPLFLRQKIFIFFLPPNVLFFLPPPLFDRLYPVIPSIFSPSRPPTIPSFSSSLPQSATYFSRILSRADGTCWSPPMSSPGGSTWKVGRRERGGKKPGQEGARGVQFPVPWQSPRGQIKDTFCREGGRKEGKRKGEREGRQGGGCLRG